MTMVIEPLARGKIDRLFFTGMAIAAAVAVFIGFWPTYFLRVAELPPLSPLYQIHGAVFMTWIFLFIAQTALVAGHRTDIHRRLGVAAAGVAAAVFILGVTVSIETMRRGGGPSGIDPRAFFAVPMGDIIVFASLTTAGILLRRQMDWHKRLMLLATISLLTAAVGRFLVQINTGGAPLGLFLGTDIFVLAVILYDFASCGRVHPATLWGAAGVVVFKPLLLLFAATPIWLAFADALS